MEDGKVMDGEVMDDGRTDVGKTGTEWGHIVLPSREGGPSKVFGN